MKALFAHDHHFIPLNGEVFTESQFPEAHWSRYLQHFDSLIVVGREGKVPAGKRASDLQRSSAPRTEFVFAPNLSSLRGQMRSRRSAHRLLRRLLADADTVIARLPSELGLLAIGEARRAGIPWAVVLAGCPWDGLWNHGSLRAKLYAPVMTLRTRAAVRASPFVLYVTRAFLQRRYPNRRGTVLGCSDVDLPAPSEQVLQARLRRIQIAPTPLVLGLIGTLKTRFKGIQTILEALAEVRRQLPPVEFRVLAGGDAVPWREEAARWGVADLVRFDGTLPGGEPVLKWLDGVDVYLQPSFKEGLPRAVVEAMSRGCPVIASTCAGIPELIESDCLIRPGDARHLGRLIVRAATSRDWQEEQAERNWREAGEYSREQLDERREPFWRRFVEYAETRSDRRVVDGRVPRRV